jgi:hypothetical protein
MMNIAKILVDRRGNALVLAVLISLALASVAVVSMRRTASDLMVAGNISRSLRAQAAGEAGLGHGLGQVGGTPDAFVNWIGANANAALDAGDPTISQKVNIWDPNPSSPTSGRGGFSTALSDAQAAFRIPHVLHDTSARIRQDVAYRTEIVPVGEIQDAPGYDVDSDICLHLFDFNTEGGIPTKFDEPVADTLGQTDTIVVRSRVRAAAGPGKCQY